MLGEPVCITDLEEPEGMSDYLWYPYIRRRLKTMVCSYGKTGGKTTLLAHVLAAMSNDAGGRLIGHIKPARVLVLTEEADKTLWMERRDLLGIGGSVYLYFPSDLLELTWKQIVGELIGKLALSDDDGLIHAPYDLYVVDSICDVMGIEDENDTGQVTKAIKLLNPLCESGAGVLLHHHKRKAGGVRGEGIRGSTAFVNATDIIVELENVARHPRRRRLKTMTRTIAPIPEATIELSADNKTYEWVKATADIIDDLLAKDSGLTQKALQARWPGKSPAPNPETIKGVMADGVRQGRYHIEGGAGVSGDSYRYELVSWGSSLYMGNSQPTQPVPASTTREKEEVG